MTDISTLVGGPDRAHRTSGGQRARVVKPPASLSGPLTVSLLAYTNDYEYEVPATNWVSRGTALPVKGTVGAAVFDDFGDVWFLVGGGTEFPAGGGGAETDPIASAALTAHAADTTAIHGIADTSLLVVTSDPRLTNARTPTVHHATHEPGGTDAMAVDAAAVTGSLRTLGPGAAQAAPGNDARLSDQRVPTDGSVTNAKVAGAAAIARSKLDFGSGLVNADIAAAAGIAKSKLAALGIVNADVDAAAAIAESKLSLASDAAAGTASRRTLGTGATQAAAGNDTRFTDARAPNGAAGGDLSGTYPNPQIATGVIVDGDVNAAAAIAESKLNLATDAAAGIGSRRTLGTTATSAAAGNRGLPAGGATGQVLAKNSATDYDAAWATASGGGGVTGEVWTATPVQAADVTNATITNVNTDLVFSFAANSTYIIDLYLMVTAAATTTGVAFAWDTSVAVTAANLTFEHQLAAAGTLTGGDAIADDTVRGLSSGVPVAAAVTPIIGSGIIITGATAGTARVRFRPEVAASATFKAGSTMRVMKVGATSGAVIPMVAGRVNAVGTIAAGTGFTVTKGTTGVYTLTFSSLVPLAVTGNSWNLADQDMFTSDTYTATSIRVVMVHGGTGAAVDRGFTFHAVGS